MVEVWFFQWRRVERGEWTLCVDSVCTTAETTHLANSRRTCLCLCRSACRSRSSYCPCARHYQRAHACTCVRQLRNFNHKYTSDPDSSLNVSKLKGISRGSAWSYISMKMGEKQHFALIWGTEEKHNVLLVIRIYWYVQRLASLWTPQQRCGEIIQLVWRDREFFFPPSFCFDVDGS